jgi:hypothetical protein
MKYSQISVAPPPYPFLQQASGRIFKKDDVNGFSSISDICFMEVGGVRVVIMRF